MPRNQNSSNPHRRNHPPSPSKHVNNCGPHAYPAGRHQTSPVGFMRHCSPPSSPVQELLCRSHSSAVTTPVAGPPPRELTFGGSRGPSPVASQNYAGPKFTGAPSPQALPMPPSAWLGAGQENAGNNGLSGFPDSSPLRAVMHTTPLRAGQPSANREMGRRIPAVCFPAKGCGVKGNDVFGIPGEGNPAGMLHILHNMGIKVRV